MPAWPTKDPETVADYRFNVPLDDGDTLATVALTKLSGSVTIDSTASDEAGITAWLSGGTDGETAVFRAAWTTAGGRTFDDIITLPVQANETAALTGYDMPGPAHLIARYPAFAAVPVATIRSWLSDATRIVTESWAEGDFAPGIMALAAHNMTLQGLGASGAANLPAGVTRFRSGAMDISVSETAANARNSGSYAATAYGWEFQIMLRRNVGTMRLVAAGQAICRI